MLTAMSVSDDETVAIKHEIDATLRSIIADAVDGAKVDDLDDIVWVLGSVWFAELTAWSNGLDRERSIADNLARASELLLP